MKLLKFALLLVLLFPIITFSQIDSLKQSVTNAETLNDTTVVKNILKIAKYYSHKLPDTALVYYKQALQISKRNNFTYLEATAENKVGTFYLYKAEYKKSLNYYNKAIELYKKGNNKKDVAKVIKNIGVIYSIKSEHKKALSYYKKSLNIYKEIGDNEGIAKNLTNIGILYFSLSNYDKAIENYEKALKVFEKLDDKYGLAIIYGNIGNIFNTQKNYKKALEYYKIALKNSEKIDNDREIARYLGSIGTIHNNTHDYKKGLEYNLKALKTYKLLDDKIGIAESMVDIGIAYENMNEYKKAETYFKKSIDIFKISESRDGEASAYVELANLYHLLYKFNLSISFAKLGLKLAEDVKDVDMQKNACLLLSDDYEHVLKYKQALKYKNIATKLNDSIFNNEKTKAITEIQTKYETQKKEKQILEQKNKLKISQLQLEKEKEQKEKQKFINKLFIFGFLIIFILSIIAFRSYLQKQKANIKLKEQKKQLAEVNDELSQTNEELKTSFETLNIQKQIIQESEEKFKAITNSANDTIILIDESEKITFWNKAAEKLFGYSKSEILNENLRNILVFENSDKIYSEWIKSINSDNYIINKIVELEGINKNGVVFPIELSFSTIKILDNWKAITIIRDISERKQHEKVLEESKNKIEKAHKDITDNINYAQTIQQTLLTKKEIINKYFSEYFILFQPKSKVSGDFYYVNKVNDYIYFAAGDCTGHGVAGGFLTVLGITYLHGIISRKNIINTNEILNELREKIKDTFKTFGNKSYNGIDIALCRLDTKNNILEYSGAYNPLWIIRNDELLEYKATRNPIGLFYKEINFKSIEIQLQKNDKLYIFSDGFADQLGEKTIKKFLTSRFKQLLINISQLPMEQQEKKLLEAHKEWKVKLEQTDDIIVMGVKI